MKRIGMTPVALQPPAPETWRERGICYGADADLWFPDGTTGDYVAQAQAAKSACGNCPVKQQCRDWSLDTRQEYGIWGGLDERERHQLLRRDKPARPFIRRGPRTPVPPCGTPEAVARHIRLHQRLDDTCAAVHSQAA